MAARSRNPSGSPSRCCMVSTSLAMAPAMVLAPLARYVDLDGPLLLAKDRAPGLRYHDSAVEAPERELWG